MKKTIATILTIFLFSYSSSAQNFEWLKKTGGEVESMTIDALGNIYTIGTFSGTYDFDSSEGVYELTAIGDAETFIKKTDAEGHLIWVENLEGEAFSHNRGRDIQVDTEGNIYIVGVFTGRVDFDPSEEESYIFSFNDTQDIFIQKLDTEGNLIWVKSIDGDGDAGSQELATSLVLDDIGNVYITGKFRGEVDFDPSTGVTELVARFGQYFVLKLDTMGDFVWAKTARESSNTDIFGASEGQNIIIDTENNIYITGSTFRVVNFNPEGNNGLVELLPLKTDMFVLKLDEDGHFVWVQHIGGTVPNTETFMRGNTLAIDELRYIYVTGYFKGTINFTINENEDEYTSGFHQDAFILKLDENGQLNWIKSLDGYYRGEGKAIQVDEDSNVYTVGSFYEKIDADPGPDSSYLMTATNPHDAFIHKLNTQGDFCWAKNIGGGVDINSGYAIAIDQLTNIFITSNYHKEPTLNVCKDSMDFTTGNGTFVLKINQVPLVVNVDDINTCEAYTWVDGIIYTSNNNTAVDTLISINGCDSIVSLNLSIHSVDLSLGSTDFNIHSHASNATFQWLDCTNGFIPIPGETEATFTPSESGNYAVEVTQNDCVGISGCINMMIVSIDEKEEREQVEIFPNPSNGLFNIALGAETQNTQLMVVDYTGRLVYQKQLNNKNQTVDLTHLPTSVYTVCIILNTGKRFYKKIVIE